MNSIIISIKKLFINNVVNRFPTTFNLVRNLLAVLGIFTTLYLIFFLTIEKPKMVQESEMVIKGLNQEIKDNNKLISKLEKDNQKITQEVGKLNSQLDDLQIKNKKYLKQYEKNIGRISTMSNNQLAKSFADAFDE
jgi:peptidoglycan hydrolase CwlO-like protein